MELGVFHHLFSLAPVESTSFNFKVHNIKFSRFQLCPDKKNHVGLAFASSVSGSSADYSGTKMKNKVLTFVFIFLLFSVLYGNLQVGWRFEDVSLMGSFD